MKQFSLYKLISTIKARMKNPLVKGMAIIAIVTLFVKALAFYKETIIAAKFGLSEVLDTFLIAVLLPTFIQSIFLNSLKHLFIPNYISEVKNNGNTSGFQAVIFLMVIAVSAVSMIFIYFFIDLFLDLIFPNQSEHYYDLVRRQLYVIMPCLVFWGISSLLSGLLEIKNKFFFSTLSSIFPLGTMLLFLFFLDDYFGNMVLAYGTLFGSLTALLYMIFVANYYKCISLSKPIMNSNVRLMLSQLPPKVSSSFLTAANGIVDKFFAGSLVIGSIAALNYGNRLPAFGVTIVIMALGNVLLPYFSRMVIEDIKVAYNYLFKILKLVFIGTLIVVAIGILFSDFIIELWLERDEFTHEDTLKVSLIQQIKLVSIPFYLCTLIIVKFLTSINKNKFMAKISFLNLVVNIILNIILIKPFGVYGLALSTTFVLIISSCFYFGFTYKQFKKLKL